MALLKRKGVGGGGQEHKCGKILTSGKSSRKIQLFLCLVFQLQCSVSKCVKVLSHNGKNLPGLHVITWRKRRRQTSPGHREDSTNTCTESSRPSAWHREGATEVSSAFKSVPCGNGSSCSAEGPGTGQGSGGSHGRTPLCSGH